MLQGSPLGMEEEKEVTVVGSAEGLALLKETQTNILIQTALLTMTVQIIVQSRWNHHFYIIMHTVLANCSLATPLNNRKHAVSCAMTKPGKLSPRQKH